MPTLNTQRRRIIAILFILLTAGLIALFISLDSTHSSTKRISKQVSELFASGEYREAAEAFEKEVGPSEAYAFSLLCTAFEKYDSGDVKEARSYLNRWQNLQKKQSNILYSDEILQLTAEFRDKVEMEYKAVLAKEAEEKSQAAASRKQYSNVSQKASLPYVGMSESNIGNTELGAPSRSEFIDNKFGEGKLGYYYWDQNKKVLFIARTENGKVSSVTDMRTVRGGGQDKQTTQTSKKKTDPYDVYDYTNPEDFYDDHYDDFLDYYAAEEYWEDHQ